jgi:hypothetical protein
MTKVLISLVELFSSTPSKASHFLGNRKRKTNFALGKIKDREICEEKELNKHLSFVNERHITEDKERQLKAIN